jgi:hypothetical protein
LTANATACPSRVGVLDELAAFFAMDRLPETDE